MSAPVDGAVIKLELLSAAAGFERYLNESIMLAVTGQRDGRRKEVRQHGEAQKAALARLQIAARKYAEFIEQDDTVLCPQCLKWLYRDALATHTCGPAPIGEADAERRLYQFFPRPVVLVCSATEWAYLLDQLQPQEWDRIEGAPPEAQSLRRKLLSAEQARRRLEEASR